MEHRPELKWLKWDLRCEDPTQVPRLREEFQTFLDKGWTDRALKFLLAGPRMKYRAECNQAPLEFRSFRY